MSRKASTLVLGLVVLALVVGGAWWLLRGPEDVGDLRPPASPVASSAAPSLPAGADGVADDVPAPLATEPGRLGVATSPVAGAFDQLTEACLSGRIVDPEGRAVADAEIAWVFDGRSRVVLRRTTLGGDAEIERLTPRAESDAEGRFELCAPWVVRSMFDSDPWGEHPAGLTVGAPGFAWTSFAAAGFAGDALGMGDLVLEPLATGIRLAVVDEFGRGVPDVEVEVHAHRGYTEALKRWGEVKRSLRARPWLTDDDGRVEVSGIPLSSVRLELHSAGHIETKLGAFDLVRNELVDVGAFVLSSSSAISGRVLDENGEALAGVQLELGNVDLVIPPLEAQGRVRVAWNGVSDDEGRFRVAGLPPTETELALSAASPEHFPWRTAPVAPGQELVVQLQRGIPLQVEVRSVRGELLPDAVLFARLLDEVTAEEQLPEKEERELAKAVEVEGFRLPRAGRLGTLLLASAPGHVPRRFRVEPCDTEAECRALIELETGVELHGDVVDRAGRPVEAAEVSVRHDDWRHQYGSRGPFASRRTRTDEDGGFSFPGLPAAAWELTVKHTAYADTTVDDLQSASASAPVRVVLTAAASAQGVLLHPDGRPAAGHSLGFIQGAGKHPGQSGSASTDVDGRFAVGGLRGGRFVVTARPGLDVEVELQRGVTREFEFELQSPAIVRGRVSLRGLPMEGIEVYARRSDRSVGDDRVRVRTDAVGRYELELSVQDEYNVAFRAEAGPWVRRQVDAMLGSTQELDVELGGARLAGRVVIADVIFAVPEGLEVEILREGRRVGDARVSADGGFSLEPLEPGDYEFAVRHPRFLPARWGPLTLAADESRDDLLLELKGAAILDLRVRDAAGRRLEGYVHLFDANTGALLVSDDVDWGRLVISSLPPGSYRVQHARHGWAIRELAGGRYEIDTEAEFPPEAVSRILGDSIFSLTAFEERVVELMVEPAPGG